MIKDILVHLDGSSEDDVRIAHAEGLAREHGAMVTGLFTLVLPAYAALSTNVPGNVMAGYEAALRSECEASLEKLRRGFKAGGRCADLRKIEGTIGNIEVQV